MKLLTLFKKKEKPINWKQVDNMIIAYNKICRCIDSSTTIKHYIACSNLIHMFRHRFSTLEHYNFYMNKLLQRNYNKSINL